VSFCVVGVMAAVSLGVLEPANIAVLYEMNKPVPNGGRIGRLMKRFIVTAGITGIMQVATLIIMTRWRRNDEGSRHRRQRGRPVVPPVAWLSTAALCLVISGGIILASYAPRVAPHSVTVTLLVAGLLLLATSVTMLLRIKEFSWTTFRSVYKWAQLAYLITAGMIEFAFAHDHTRGRRS